MCCPLASCAARLHCYVLCPLKAHSRRQRVWARAARRTRATKLSSSAISRMKCKTPLAAETPATTHIHTHTHTYTHMHTHAHTYRQISLTLHTHTCTCTALTDTYSVYGCTSASPPPHYTCAYPRMDRCEQEHSVRVYADDSGLGFSVEGSGFRVQGSGLWVEGLVLRVEGCGIVALKECL